MSDSAELPYLYLMTTGRLTGQPREIEIWFTTHAGRHYVIAETGERAQWFLNLQAHPHASWRVGERVHSGQARRIDADAEPDLHATVTRLSVEKYGWGEGLVVELCPGGATTPGDPLPPALSCPA